MGLRGLAFMVRFILEHNLSYVFVYNVEPRKSDPFSGFLMYSTWITFVLAFMSHFLLAYMSGVKDV